MKEEDIDFKFKKFFLAKSMPNYITLIISIGSILLAIYFYYNPFTYSHLILSINSPYTLYVSPSGNADDILHFLLVSDGTKKPQNVTFQIEVVKNISNSCNNTPFFTATCRWASSVQTHPSCSVSSIPLEGEYTLDLSQDVATFVEKIGNFGSCEIIQAIRICPFYENSLQRNQCSEPKEITINYQNIR